MNKKGVTPILIILIILVIGGGISYFVFSGKGFEENPPIIDDVDQYASPENQLTDEDVPFSNNVESDYNLLTCAQATILKNKINSEDLTVQNVFNIVGKIKPDQISGYIDTGKSYPGNIKNVRGLRMKKNEDYDEALEIALTDPSFTGELDWGKPTDTNVGTRTFAVSFLDGIVNGMSIGVDVCPR